MNILTLQVEILFPLTSIEVVKWKKNILHMYCWENGYIWLLPVTVTTVVFLPYWKFLLTYNLIFYCLPVTSLYIAEFCPHWCHFMLILKDSFIIYSLNLHWVLWYKTQKGVPWFHSMKEHRYFIKIWIRSQV